MIKFATAPPYHIMWAVFMISECDNNVRPSDPGSSSLFNVTDRFVMALHLMDIDTRAFRDKTVAYFLLDSFKFPQFITKLFMHFCSTDPKF